MTERTKCHIWLIAMFTLGTSLAVFAATGRISVQTDLEGTRATISCADNKEPNVKFVRTPTDRQIVVLDCVREK